MPHMTVLVIEQGAEAALVCAALAQRPEVRVVDAPDLDDALKRLDQHPEPVALAIAGAAALAGPADQLVARLAARGIPVIGVAPGLDAEAKERALAAGVREIHDRPSRWRPYSELISSVVSRFIPGDSPRHPGRTS